MNISSIVVLISDEKAVLEIKKIEKCKIYARDDKKIVVVIDADNINETIEIFRKIELINGVENIDMIYSYDDEEMADFENVSEILNSDCKISYGGDVKNLLK